ncbi:hypothetical protein BDF19DRAFT_433016 [Syncephalis fuscata]|nr:hypothetical protein BDF19DRAFT_433016 [Syncephalis fuscata]
MFTAVSIRSTLLTRACLATRVGAVASRGFYTGSSTKDEVSSGRLQEFSRRLEEGPTLDDFITGNTSDANTLETIKTATTTTRRPRERLPSWLKQSVPTGSNFQRIRKNLRELNLHTVCEEAKCPNISDCWGGGEHQTATATIMVIALKTPKPLDPNEPENTADAISRWGVDYIVMTSVDRDDLPDGGSEHFAQTIRRLKEKAPHILVECLTGDFQGNLDNVATVALSGLDVYAHNIETVEGLQKYVRDRRAGYRQSIGVLEHAKKVRPGLFTKTSIMLGCGETDEEVLQAMKDLRASEVDCLTLGQYMRPTRKHMKVSEYVPPEKFEHWQKIGEQMGFKYVASGPLVRSSYKAGEFFISNILRANRSSSLSSSV